MCWDEFGADLPIPEKRLLLAVILRAVFDYTSVARADREHRRTARIFLFSDNPRLSDFRLMAQLLFTDHERVVEGIRSGLKNGTLRPTKVAPLE